MNILHVTHLLIFMKNYMYKFYNKISQFSLLRLLYKLIYRSLPKNKKKKKGMFELKVNLTPSMTINYALQVNTNFLFHLQVNMDLKEIS